MAASPSLTMDASWSSEESEDFIWPTLPSEGFEDGWLQDSISAASSGSAPLGIEPGRPLCSGCEATPGEKYCTKCNIIICRSCCNAIPTHRGPAPSHPVVSYQEHKLFNEIVSHQAVDENLQHRHDFLSLWFSVDKGKDGKLELKQFPRFSNLVKDHNNRHRHGSDCSVQLVSFIGNTGAGKSTLIRVLMKQPWDIARLTSTEEVSISLPIAGRSGSTIPTSGDVHLYAVPNDPAAGPSNLSLYADCEGFNGGDQEPLAGKAKRSVLAKIGEMIHTKTTESLSWAKDVLLFLKGTHIFPLSFESTREEAVKNLFPRLLYNFSDVVVHVMPWAASRMLEHVIVNLLDWAQNSQKTAVNRVILPHMIVVLNVDLSEEVDWNTATTTERILNEHLRALENNQTISTYCWMLNQLRNSPITTIRELLNCCYSSVQFIRVPPAEKQQLFSRQVQTLDSLIHEATIQARETKAEARCLLHSETQDKMFKMAFEHYKNNLEKPFDFLESLLAARPLDNTLSATLSALLRAAMIAYRSTTAELSGFEFCSIITPTVCSIIALDSYRSSSRHPGTLRNIYKGSTLNFRVGEGEEGAVTYQSQFAAAITEFLEKSCPCDFVYEGKRCVNSFQGHKASMHQDETGSTHFGTFESKFVDDWTRCWNAVIDDCFSELDDPLGKPGTAEQPEESMMVWSAHCLNLRNLYSDLPQLDITKIKTCSWCFYGEPLRSLECGHRVCWACAELVGDSQAGSSNEDKIVVAVGSCELHPTLVRFESPIHIIKESDTTAIVLSSRT
ncbi:uncharacterized protein B0I36DRAFT_341025 [Microdochium trichocladiopsis]|uniref:B box-type domain-containing protein n=1 Tax=Microdochium trichocladiopsis TaxID=1682393 RepID=A0A9P8XQ36_9PEZI|nr:uncharacterized protein B0I36DRAFT_341025 [Microdochium trichocladiopsis]KAH7010796.1 hypothetical protein B0I36DRAFT_341025 [Microdochium trichocladiopsis]